MATRKSFEYKVFDINYTYITAWDDATFDSFNAVLDGGLGNLTITLARKFADFDEGVSVKESNIVEIWVKDQDTPATRIYSGVITAYAPLIDGRLEEVEVFCLGFLNVYAVVPYKNGTATTIVQNSVDPTNIVKDVVDRVSAEFPSDALATRIAYNATSIPSNTGTTVSYTFNADMALEALIRAQDLAPDGWHYYLGGDNLLQFKQTASQPKHQFIFGRDFKKIQVFKNVENVRNSLIFWNGRDNDDGELISKLYTDTDSITSFGNRWEKSTDGRVKIEGTADTLGTAFVNANKDLDIRTTVEILDTSVDGSIGYNIESIICGDTCTFLNLPSATSKTFNYNMLVVSVDYHKSFVRLEIESKTNNTARNLASIKRQLNNQDYGEGQPAYTT